MKRITTEVDAKQWRDVKVEAARRGVFIHQVLHSALEWWLKNAENYQPEYKPGEGVEK